MSTVSVRIGLLQEWWKRKRNHRKRHGKNQCFHVFSFWFVGGRESQHCGRELHSVSRGPPEEITRIKLERQNSLISFDQKITLVLSRTWFAFLPIHSSETEITYCTFKRTTALAGGFQTTSFEGVRRKFPLGSVHMQELQSLEEPKPKAASQASFQSLSEYPQLSQTSFNRSQPSVVTSVVTSQPNSERPSVKGERSELSSGKAPRS